MAQKSVGLMRSSPGRDRGLFASVSSLTAEQWVKRLRRTSMASFASHSKARTALLPQAAGAEAKEESAAYPSPSSGVSPPAQGKRPRLDWATLHARTWGIDVWKCRCGGKRKVSAVVTSRCTAEAMLRNLGLLKPPPPLPAAQSSPQIELAV